MPANTTEVNLRELRPLIDCDILLYRCGFSADSQVKREFKAQDSTSSDEEIAEAMQELDYVHFALGNVKQVMEDMVSLFSPEYRAFLTGKGNFREQIATILPYKGNRDPTHKPKYYNEIKEYLINVWNAEVINGREADDALGCAQWEAKDRSTVIVSNDKDLDTIPGYHYNWVKKEFYDVSMNTANLNLFKQMLEGDRTDNIPGIDNIGPKRSNDVLRACDYDLDQMRDAVKKIYQDTYGPEWEAYYREVGSLLYIQRVEGQECNLL